MIKYKVGEIKEIRGKTWIITKAKTDCLPWEQEYTIYCQTTGETKQVGLFNLTHGYV